MPASPAGKAHTWEFLLVLGWGRDGRAGQGLPSSRAFLAVGSRLLNPPATAVQPRGLRPTERQPRGIALARSCRLEGSNGFCTMAYLYPLSLQLRCPCETAAVGLSGFPITRPWLAATPVSQAGVQKALLAGCCLTLQGLETPRRCDQRTEVERKKSRKSSRHSVAPVTSNTSLLLSALWSLGGTPVQRAWGKGGALGCAKIVLCLSCQVPL